MKVDMGFYDLEAANVAPVVPPTLFILSTFSLLCTPLTLGHNNS